MEENPHINDLKFKLNFHSAKITVLKKKYKNGPNIIIHGIILLRKL